MGLGFPSILFNLNRRLVGETLGLSRTYSFREQSAYWEKMATRAGTHCMETILRPGLTTLVLVLGLGLGLHSSYRFNPERHLAKETQKKGLSVYYT